VADNKRFVSYMYEYKRDEKGNNAGYTRVDARGSQCKILVHISQQASNGRLLKAYMFYRKPGKYRFAYLGNILMSEGSGELKVKTDRDNVMNSDIGLNDFCGVVVYDSGKTYFACEWDEEPITHTLIDHIDNLDLGGSQEVVLKKNAGENVIDSSKGQTTAAIEQGNTSDAQGIEQVEPVQSTDSFSFIRAEELEPVSDKEREIAMHKRLEEEAAPTVEQPPSEETAAFNSTGSVQQTELHTTSCPEVECVEPTYGTCGQNMEQGAPRAGAYRYECHPAAQNIFRKFPRIYPFEDYEICDCVRIEPKDIGLFPIDAWVLGNNSFLLHGYYTYQHLIFGKINSNEGIIYVLGVPGIYQNRESFMAKMFGFEYFKCAKATERRNGEFGYYYQPIQFQ